MDAGGFGYSFVGDYSEVGCFSYRIGRFDGSVFYGTGGTIQQIQENVSGTKYRPKGYDCLEGKCFFVLYNLKK